MKYLIRAKHRAHKDGFSYAIADRKPPKHRETLDYDVKVFELPPPLDSFALHSAQAMCEADLLREA